MADTIYVNDDGLKQLVDLETGKSGTALGSATLRLFTSPTTVSQTNVIGDFTQATFPGYAAQALTAATWAAATVSAHTAQSTYGATITFTHSASAGSQTVYGAYLTDAGNTKLYMCWLFASGPYVMANNGDSISIVPTWSQVSAS